MAPTLPPLVSYDHKSKYPTTLVVWFWLGAGIHWYFSRTFEDGGLDEEESWRNLEEEDE